MSTKILTAHNQQEGHLFFRFVFNKADGRRQIMASVFLHSIAYVHYNKKVYSISEIYRKWPIERA